MSPSASTAPSTAPSPVSRTSLPTHLHDWIEQAPWRRPELDRVAGLLGRGERVRPALRRAPAPRLAPQTAHTVSVIVPCFNYGRFLPQSVGSALSQAHADVEVIVVDDASTDDSLDVALAMAGTDPRVRVLRNAVNLGHVRTFNRGHALATGEFIVRLDADDLLTPGSLARALALFETHPGVGLVYGHPRHFATPEPPRPRQGRVTWSVWSGRSWVEERCRVGVNCITTPEAVVRASVMAQVGPLNTALRLAQDMELWLRVAAVSDVARVDDVDQALHRDHEASMSVNEGAGTMTDLRERRLVFGEALRATGDRFENRVDVEAAYRRALAREAIEHAAYAWDRGRHRDEDAAQLLGFAQETCAEVASWPAWHRVQRRLRRERRRPPVVELLRVARRRLRDELAYLRWARTGL